MLSLVALPALFFRELIFGNKALIYEDLNWQHYPLQVLTPHLWRLSSWPLWNPYVMCGLPLLAEQSVGVLYPPTDLLFVLPLPPHVALSLFALLHLALAALFTYLLGRSFGLQPAGALLAGLSFGFGGVLTAQITSLYILASLAWMPLVLCLIIVATERQNARFALLGGLALALQVLAVNIQVVFYTALLVVGYAAYRTVSAAREGERGKALWWPVLMVACTGAVGSALAVPHSSADLRAVAAFGARERHHLRSDGHRLFPIRCNCSSCSSQTCLGIPYWAIRALVTLTSLTLTSA